MCGNNKKFSWCKLGIGTAEVAGETTNDREFPGRGCFAGFIKIPFSDFEQVIANQQFAFRFDQLRLHVFEIDAFNRLFNVQIPLHSGRWIGTIPIERPVSRVAILLDFEEEVACAYRMHPAGREENGIACLNGDRMNAIDHSSIAQSLPKLVARDRLTKSEEKLGVWIPEGHVPELAFRFASQSAGNIFGRMYLQRQFLLRIENFDEQRKTWSIGHLSEDFLSALRPQFVQS